MTSTAKCLVLVLVLMSCAVSFARDLSGAERYLINTPEGQMLLKRLEMFLDNTSGVIPLSDEEANIRPASKRQIRYHQCYFNPISCFRRRK